MIWIEMSREELHGGGEWGFAACVWSPAYKNEPQKRSWAFWNNIRNVKVGDTIIHLRGIGDKAAFVGFSTAITDGHKTTERPPFPGDWGYSKSYFRAMLTDYHNFESPVKLIDFFSANQDALINYLKNLPQKNKNRFFVYQSNRLQCLNGAYLSACDDRLLELITGQLMPSTASTAVSHVATSEIHKTVLQRRGQARFSDAVKDNYNCHCCFPRFSMNDRHFLIGSHIARWVDSPDKRGEVANGLCLCCFHDKAFEVGYFSLDDEYKVTISSKKDIAQSAVFQTFIMPHAGEQISLGNIKPDKDSLSEHRFRCEISD